VHDPRDLFVQLAMQLPCLTLTWEKLERKFTSISKISLATRFKIVTAVVMLLALMVSANRNEQNENYAYIFYKRNSS